MIQEVELITADGTPLAAKLFLPEKSAGKVLVINSATGVRQHLYQNFAGYHTENGITVITYDYRGIGASLRSPLSASKANMQLWGTQDFNAVAMYVLEKFPQYQKFCLGHSVGALIVGMSHHSENFDHFFFVATQDAYFRNLNFPLAVAALAGFGIALPVLTAVLGYFPAPFFGLGEALPAGVALDWRTLILNKKSTAALYDKIYSAGGVGLQQSVDVLFADDDTWITRAGMRSLLARTYPNLKPQFWELHAADSPQNHIGHVNFFRSYNRVLWEPIFRKMSQF